MGMSIRNLLVALEAVENVAAVGTFDAVKFKSFKPKSNDARELVKEENATLVDEEDYTAGPTTWQADLEVEIYLDQIGIWLAMLGGTPVTTTDPGGAVGTFQHVWKRSVTGGRAATFKWYDGIAWRQAAGVLVDSAEIDQAADKRWTLKLKLVGRGESEISTPTIPAFAYAAYDHPVSSNQQVFKVAGSTDTNLISSKWMFKNNRKPKQTTQATSAPKKFKQGKLQQNVDLLAEFAAYAGSYYEAMKTNVDIGALLLTVSATTAIGTGAPTVPSLAILFPKPRSSDGDRNFDKEDTEQTAKIMGKPDSATASAATFTLINEKAAATFTGS